MRPSMSPIATAIAIALVAASCGSAPSPSPTATPALSALPASHAAMTPTPGAGSTGPTASPSPHRPASASLPVHGHALELGEGVRMTPGPNGTLFVALPRSGGSVLTQFDRNGRPTPGWPIEIKGSTSRGLLLPVADGSVRTVCTMENPEGNMVDPTVAFAYDPTGGLLDGWPVELIDNVLAGRMIGDDLIVVVSSPRSDVVESGKPTDDVALATIAASGELQRGTSVPVFETCCRWTIGPDGVVYFVGVEKGADVGFDEVSRITALDLAGIRPGWPITVDGTGSRPASGPDGQIVVTVSSYVRGTTRVLSFDPDRTASSSAELSPPTSSYAETGGCQPSQPQAPVIDENGRIFVWSEMDDTILALDPSLEQRGGWPYRTATTLVRPDSRYVQEDAFCPGLTAPTVGPDGTLYLSVQATDATVGGSLVAVDPVGRERAGWPVALRRPGGEFWSGAVGADGTVYALAVELESSRTSSASVLAIAPDSTVLYTTTIIDP